VNHPAQTQSQSQSNTLSLPRLAQYQTEGFFDELVDHSNVARPETEALVALINQLPPDELLKRQRDIERSLFQMGITFTVYSDDAGTEKIMPFDVVPRIVPTMSWLHIEAGLQQRIRALNRFLGDIYSDQAIVHDHFFSHILNIAGITSCFMFYPCS
jgi:uncharacterized circularly permuted ATP-grasp superfamily protein